MRIGKKALLIFAVFMLGWCFTTLGVTKDTPRAKYLNPNQCGKNAVNPNCEIDWEKYCVATVKEMSPLLGIEYKLASGVRGFEPAYILPGEKVAVDPNTMVALMRLCCCNRIRDIKDPRKIVTWVPAEKMECETEINFESRPIEPIPEPEDATPLPQETVPPAKEPITIPKINIENPPIKPHEPMGPEVAKKPWYSTGWGRTLLIGGGAVAACLAFDIGPCDNDDDRDGNKGCKFGKGIDGHCLHPCNPEDPNCTSPPPCTPGGGPDCPCPPEHPDCDADITRSQTFGEFMTRRTNIHLRKNGFEVSITVPFGKKPNPAP